MSSINSPRLPDTLAGSRLHLVGIKGTGMCALAEILCAAGAHVSGSDVAEHFYTDTILESLGLRPLIGFEASHIDADIACVIHSAAYKRTTNPELMEAERRGIPLLLYTQALGDLSRKYDSSGISGVHGKTTTTAISGSLLKQAGLPATVLAGSAVSNFGGRSTLVMGDRYFVAETCEYQRHFLSFSPSRIVLTSIECDHQDYFSGFEDILSAFVEYGRNLRSGGSLIFCADDPGALRAATQIKQERPDILLIPYGLSAQGPFRLNEYRLGNGEAFLRLAGFSRDFSLRIPGRHIALDACAALTLACEILLVERGLNDVSQLANSDIDALAEGLKNFSGSKRRAEIIGESGSVLIMDDYAHHPTAIARTLEGLKEFHPGRRLVVDFMPHTYSRTKALLSEFASCFTAADELILHKIYPSAREEADTSISGESLFRLCKQVSPRVSYFEEPEGAVDYLADTLKPKDLFITMGAGDNWKLGPILIKRLAEKKVGQ